MKIFPACLTFIICSTGLANSAELVARIDGSFGRLNGDGNAFAVERSANSSDNHHIWMSDSRAYSYTTEFYEPFVGYVPYKSAGATSAAASVNSLTGAMSAFARASAAGSNLPGRGGADTYSLVSLTETFSVHGTGTINMFFNVSGYNEDSPTFGETTGFPNGGFTQAGFGFPSLSGYGYSQAIDYFSAEMGKSSTFSQLLSYSFDVFPKWKEITLSWFAVLRTQYDSTADFKGLAYFTTSEGLTLTATDANFLRQSPVTGNVPVPGPEAGAGLGALAMGGMALYMKRRRKEDLVA